MRYCVNATVAVDAWAYVEADNPEDADEKASALSASDFALADAEGGKYPPQPNMQTIGPERSHA